MTATDDATPVPDARAVLALLANDDARRMFARIVLGDELDVAQLPKRERHAVERLTAAGVVTDAAGRLAVDAAGLRAAVARYSPPRVEGIDRFVRDGRIVNYPASDDDRVELLGWVGRQVLQPAERVTEPELNERLRPYFAEHVLLRRYLVDYRVLDRAPDGSWYALAERSLG